MEPFQGSCSSRIRYPGLRGEAPLTLGFDMSSLQDEIEISRHSSSWPDLLRQGVQTMQWARPRVSPFRCCQIVETFGPVGDVGGKPHHN